MSSNLKIFSATHDDGEKAKRYGYRAPTFDAWWEVFQQTEMPDHAVGVLLNLTSDEVQDLKSYIRQELRSAAPTIATTDMYYLTLPTSFESYSQSPGASYELLCKKGNSPLGWHFSPSNETNTLRSYVSFAVTLAYPALFKEPSTVDDYRKEWQPNNHACYEMVPIHFRREVLRRMVDTCGEEMKRDASLRDAATESSPSKKKPAASNLDGNTGMTSLNKRSSLHADIPPNSPTSNVPTPIVPNLKRDTDEAC